MPKKAPSPTCEKNVKEFVWGKTTWQQCYISSEQLSQASYDQQWLWFYLLTSTSEM